MSIFLKNEAITKLINFLKLKGNVDYLTDSSNLSNVFHQYGVNMRYLGAVHKHELLKDNA